MHQRQAARVCLADQRIVELRRFGDLRPGVDIIRLDAQRLEERAVIEGGCDLVTALECGAVDRAQ
jgi:hypothetical protein